MLAFVFPGQGSQKVGMGKELQAALPEVARLYQEADEALGFSLSRLCFEGPEAELQLTTNTQPAILATSVAALRAVQVLAGLSPQVVAGHSLGEYSALVATGALAFADAVRLVHQRGRFMQEAVPAGVGAMAAIIGLDAHTVAEVCRAAIAGEHVVCAPANFNGAGQVVIAGMRSAVERALGLCKERGAKLAKLLPVSAPFHCSLMQPAADRLSAELARVPLGPLAVPVVTNVDAEANQDPERVRELLVRQVTGAVRWEESVRQLAAMGVTDVVELGPGRVLTGLVKRITPSVRLWNVETPAEALALKEANLDRHR